MCNWMQTRFELQKKKREKSVTFLAGKGKHETLGCVSMFWRLNNRSNSLHKNHRLCFEWSPLTTTLIFTKLVLKERRRKKSRPVSQLQTNLFMWNMKLRHFSCLARKDNFQKLALNQPVEADRSKLIRKLLAAEHISARLGTYVLWDLDEGEGILGGLGWQGPGAEGRRHGGQTGGWHDFSLKEDEGQDTLKHI